jgi:hypothetical protein
LNLGDVKLNLMDVKLNLGDVTFVYKIVVRIFLVDVDSNINIIVYWKGIRIQCNYHSHRRLHHSHPHLVILLIK